MRKPLDESAIVFAVADLAGAKIARKVIEALQGIEATLSGDDSELATVWDEICVQIQFEQSTMWDEYNEIVKDFVESMLAELMGYEQAALWLQTENGHEWLSANFLERTYNLDCTEDLKEHVTQHYIYTQAADWENDEIQQYIARQHEHD